MARLQILELPEGSGDERPPFVLVVDRYEPPPYPGEPEQSPLDGVAEKIGARAVLAFEDTIDIPTNDTSGYNGIPGGDYTAFAAAVEHALGIDTSTAVPDVAGWLLTACRELEKSETAREHLRQERDAQAAAIQRVRDRHRPVDHQGQAICVECSAYDFTGPSTDNAPVAYADCGTLKALAGYPATTNA